MLNVRNDFPALNQTVRGGKNLVYLDSAATALKPNVVIDRLHHFYSMETSNVHRGAHYLSDLATTAFEKSRESVKDFLNAEAVEDIVFTKGTTEAINLVASILGHHHIQSGDEIIVTEMEHHANLIPWQELAARTGAILKIAPISVTDGTLDMPALQKLMDPRTKLVAVTQASNTLGTVNDVAKICQWAHAVGALCLVDAAQSVVAMPIDVQAIACDFLCFSAHKLFGPYGVGVVYAKQSLWNSLPPYQFGGSMIDRVDYQKSSYLNAPHRFEAGTPNISGVIGLGAAIEYVQKLTWSEIQVHEDQLLSDATTALKQIQGLTIHGQAPQKTALISFSVDGCHPADIGQMLDQEGIAVRVGHHCTQPLMKRLGVIGTVRASFSIYNNKSDVEIFVEKLQKVVRMLR
jgi:cysteine desulfurase/selenocysteine lyase